MATQQYSALVNEYFWRPVRACRADIHGAGGSLAAGIRVEFAAELSGGRLQKVGFRAFACPHIIACCNWLAEQLEGQAPDALCDLQVPALRQKFDIPVEKAGKLLILKDALDAGYKSYRQLSTAG